MKRSIFSVWDRKAQSFGPVFDRPHEASAMRDFSQAVLDPQLQLGKYPDDFCLMEIAKFDDDGSVEGAHPDAVRVPFPCHGIVPRIVLEAAAVLALQARGPERVKEA